MAEFPLERRSPSFGLAELVGRNVEDAEERCVRDGFDAQVVDVEKTSAITLELRHDRIRRGVVEGCRLG